MSKHIDIDAIGYEEVKAFADFEGAYMVWFAWKSNMQAQGREVSPERLNWTELPEQDKELDRKIAEGVVACFIAWLDKNSKRIEGRH